MYFVYDELVEVRNRTRQLQQCHDTDLVIKLVASVLRKSKRELHTAELLKRVHASTVLNLLLFFWFD